VAIDTATALIEELESAFRKRRIEHQWLHDSILETTGAHFTRGRPFKHELLRANLNAFLWEDELVAKKKQSLDDDLLGAKLFVHGGACSARDDDSFH
jgi:hypothetical protein